MVRRRHSQNVLLLLVALGALGIGALVSVTGVLNTQEAQSVDTRFAIRGPMKPPSNILLVAVDARTVARLNLGALADEFTFFRG